MLIKIVKSLGCAYGCGEGHRGLSGDRLRHQVFRENVRELKLIKVSPLVLLTSAAEITACPLCSFPCIDSKCVAFCPSSQTVLQPSRSRFSTIVLPSSPWDSLRAHLWPRVLLTTPVDGLGQYMGANSMCELVLVIFHRTVPQKSMLFTRGAAILGCLCESRSLRCKYVHLS